MITADRYNYHVLIFDQLNIQQYVTRYGFSKIY